MNEPFVILHLSDAHIGNPKHRWDSINVFDSLIKDLENVSKEHSIKPDLIIFSGDLAFGELPEIKLTKQYELADEFLKKVINVFDNSPKIFLVPGNHDINRKKIDESQKPFRDSLNEEKVEKMMVANDITFQRFLERQSEWKEFAKSILNGFDFDDDLNFISGIVEHKGKKIGVVGLNSAWASQGDGEIGKLWIGKNQIERALQKVKDADFKVVASHHPHSWLNPSDKGLVRDRLQSSFQIFLHGHEHSDWFEEHKGHLVVSAGACYQGSKNQNGYDWITIDFDAHKGNIYLREYSDRAGGGWTPRKIPGKTDDKGKAELKILFKDKVSEDNYEETNIAVVPTTKIISSHKTLDQYINYLDRDFRFIWERPETSIDNSVVFWAVRLRTPTPIHAVQSFVAAGLQKRGCEVILWLDDLGRTDFSDKGFFARVDRWFEKVGGDKSLLKKRKFKELYESDEKAIFFRTYVKRWLGENNIYRLPEVLKVSKLTKPEDDSLGQLSDRKPRRILTPSMVWASLAVLFTEQPNRTIITLGGYDEEPLWKAWKECVREEDTITGHLYTPILKDEAGKPIHMETFKIGWNNRNDVLNTIREEIDKENWQNEDRFIPWCFNLFSLLPRDISESNTPIKVGDKEISSFAEILSLNLNSNELVNFFTDEFSEWIVYS